MKYKIGDRVRIVSKRVYGMNREGKMDRWLCQVMTISGIEVFFYDVYYKMKEDDGRWCWNENMIVGLAEPELTVAEALRTFFEMCTNSVCRNCELGSYIPCNRWVRDNPEKALEICMKWKADHEKEAPEIETVDICRIEKILVDGSTRCVHEEDIKPDPDLPYGSERLAAEEILKRYCMEHEGTYRAVHEVVSRVKAVK